MIGEVGQELGLKRQMEFVHLQSVPFFVKRILLRFYNITIKKRDCDDGTEAVASAVIIT